MCETRLTLTQTRWGFPAAVGDFSPNLDLKKWAFQQESPTPAESREISQFSRTSSQVLVIRASRPMKTGNISVLS